MYIYISLIILGYPIHPWKKSICHPNIPSAIPLPHLPSSSQRWSSHIFNVGLPTVCHWTMAIYGWFMLVYLLKNGDFPLFLYVDQCWPGTFGLDIGIFHQFPVPPRSTSWFTHLCDAVMSRPKLGRPIPMRSMRLNKRSSANWNPDWGRLRPPAQCCVVFCTWCSGKNINRCLRCLHDGIYMDLIWFNHEDWRISNCNHSMRISNGLTR